MLRQSKPTESELDILSILWKKKKATVREVHEELSLTKEAGYTTTLKLMQIMHEKEFLLRDDSNRSHIYSPAISQEQTQKQFLDKMIHHLFAGSPANLVLQTLGNSKPSQDELEKIEQLIQSMKQA